MNPLARAYWTAKGVGFDNVPRRLLQAWRARSGWLRKRLDPQHYSDPAYRRACGIAPDAQPDLWRERVGKFFVVPSAEQLKSVTDETLWDEHVLKTCRRALAGEYPFFSRWTGRLGWPPNFNRDPVHDIDWPVGEHWLGTARSGPPRHDIKLVWEPSRLTLAYHLARAYRHSGDGRWAQALWEMFDAWVEQNPPQLTAAWGCGQETAFRLMAMLTGAFATLDSAHATAERLDALGRFAWQAALRIEVNLNYAISQENNHGLSEALGLWTVGLLFDEFAESPRWRDRGAKVIANECKRQIYKDGSFVQHSLSYHRVMLDDLMWAIRLGQINGHELPAVVMERFRLAAGWLSQLVDPVSGRVPNYGSNDGANVLPLSCSDYLDYRPTLQAAHLVAHGTRCWAPGPWDEKALWLCGEGAGDATTPIARKPSWSAPDGGYHVLRGGSSWVMTRCCAYTDRPHQSDMLHVDLWHRGENVLRDAGSFMYYHEDPHLAHYFHSTAAHNTAVVDGRDHMTKGPRFLWFRWPRGHGGFGSDARFTGRVVLPSVSGARLERTIERHGDAYVITDTINGGDPAVRWRLLPTHWRASGDQTWQAEVAGEPWAIRIAPAEGLACELTEGWESLYYGEKTPCPVLHVTGATGTIQTLVGPLDQIEGIRAGSNA